MHPSTVWTCQSASTSSNSLRSELWHEYLWKMALEPTGRPRSPAYLLMRSKHTYERTSAGTGSAGSAGSEVRRRPSNINCDAAPETRLVLDESFTAYTKVQSMTLRPPDYQRRARSMTVFSRLRTYCDGRPGWRRVRAASRAKAGRQFGDPPSPLPSYPQGKADQ